MLVKDIIVIYANEVHSEKCFWNVNLLTPAAEDGLSRLTKGGAASMGRHNAR